MESFQQSSHEEVLLQQQQVTLDLDLTKYEHLLQWVQKIEENYTDFDVPLESLQNEYNNQVEEKVDKISTNRLGGQYSTGRPLPMEIREKIVELAKLGLKPCQISKQLLVSHGCVSKLLAKWRKTGTVKPEKIGGSRPKKVLPTVANAITVYKSWLPRLQSWQIKECLIRDGICTQNNVPSVSSINKTLRNKRRIKPDFDIVNSLEIKRYLTENRTSSTNCTGSIVIEDEQKPVVTSNQLLPQSQPHPPLTTSTTVPPLAPPTLPESLALPKLHESSMNCAISKPAEYQESNFFVPQMMVDHYQMNQNQNCDNFDFFVSSSSSSSSDYGSMSFTESPPDFGDLLTFLDDVFLE